MVPWIACVVGRSVVVLLTVLLPSVVIADPTQTYLALGDSIAFGETNIIPTSFGDQGYVKLYADFLATQNAGVRPDVINLAIPGETSTSFLTGISSPGFAVHSLLDSVNLNYQGNPLESQNSLMLNRIASERSAGHVISTVSFALGTNDLRPFELANPDFFSLPPLQQAALVNGFFATLTTNYITTLSEIRTALPDARLLLLNYYNPNAIFGPADVFNIIDAQFDAGQTEVIDGLATPFDARVVDIHTPFVGHEADLTYILSGDVHPNALGYGVIADRMISATVPEPSTVALLVSGLIALGAMRWIRVKIERRRLSLVSSWHIQHSPVITM
jgi:lysophospholipase L1-like esterase